MTIEMLGRLLLAGVSLMLVGLAFGPDDGEAAGPMKSPNTPATPFVTGPRVDDPTALRHWLDRQRTAADAPRLLRLPVRVALETDVPRRVRSWLGAPAGGDSLEIRLDDTALGIALPERVTQYCKGPGPCFLWLEGTWLGDVEGQPTFAVTRVAGGLAERERAGFLYAGVAVPGAPAALLDCLNRLGLNVYPENKEAAANDLVKAGTAAIPLLIAALDDERPFEKRDAANRMNLPPGQNPPPLWVTVPVGHRCADLLYRIITPAVDVPGNPNFKVYSEQILSVADWSRFWAARRSRSLAEIHAELAPLVRAYWDQHGTTQVVP